MLIFNRRNKKIKIVVFKVQEIYKHYAVVKFETLEPDGSYTTSSPIDLAVGDEIKIIGRVTLEGEK